MIDVYFLADLGYGDSGKGTLTDYLVRNTGSMLVVRYNGGPQCGHNVVTPEGVHHCFAQFGSGSFIPGVATYLSRFMLIEPYAFLNELEVLQPKLKGIVPTVYVEEDARVITPYDWATNRAKEKHRGESRHGSCGFGLGEAREREIEGGTVLTVSDLQSSELTRHKLQRICAEKIRSLAAFGCRPVFGSKYIDLTDLKIDKMLERYERFVSRVSIVPRGSLTNSAVHHNRPIIFEGGQGMLLDELYGFAPYHTWTDITFRNADILLSGTEATKTKIGVMRTFMTRHGAGPFVTEAPAGFGFKDHNVENKWQGRFRQGYLDIVALRYSLRALGGVDYLAVTHRDVLPGLIPSVTMYVSRSNKIASEMDQLGSGDDLTSELFACVPQQVMARKLEDIERLLGAEIGIVSSGPTALKKEQLVRI